MDENLVTQNIIGAAIEVHRSIGPGLLESVYQRCLAREMSLREITFQQEVPIGICYKGISFEKRPTPPCGHETENNKINDLDLCYSRGLSCRFPGR